MGEWWFPILELGLDVGDLHLFKDFNIGDEYTPVDVKNGLEALLVEPFKESLVVLISDPRLCAIQEGGKDNGFIHTGICVFLQLFVVPNVCM